MASNLREAVARAIGNYDDAKYAKRDGWEPGINTYDAEPEFREDYLKQADAAIAAVLDHLIAAAETKDIAISWFGTITVTAKDGSERDATGFCDGHLAEWLRSFREAGQ